jgi:hypothetical protein
MDVRFGVRRDRASIGNRIFKKNPMDSASLTRDTESCGPTQRLTRTAMTLRRSRGSPRNGPTPLRLRENRFAGSFRFIADEAA